MEIRSVSDSPLTGGVIPQPRILIIGLGNPLLGDDGFGWRVASHVECALQEQSKTVGEGETHSSMVAAVEVERLAVGGLRLMEQMIGYDAAILIDAITLGQQPIGSLYSYSLESLPSYSVGHLYSAHDTSLQVALEMGRNLVAKLPDAIWVIGVEVEPTFIFSESLTPAIMAAVPCAVQLVIKKLDQIAEEVL
ncbi:MAG: hydrogenase expression/formation protein [Chloroflexota bacterium]|nr:hydrogenase maturation protease [Chloroflexota bacterium]NOG64377.1 hydrogenase maturation protease [Chloroflexota bacterium]GIK67224.1 MAG: hydrogenase expression/formation protein [Chloroflexota bacterium]